MKRIRLILLTLGLAALSVLGIFAATQSASAANDITISTSRFSYTGSIVHGVARDGAILSPAVISQPGGPRVTKVISGNRCAIYVPAHSKVRIVQVVVGQGVYKGTKYNRGSSGINTIFESNSDCYVGRFVFEHKRL